MTLFCVCKISAALVTESPGNVVGMYIRVPSFRLGMNSVPSCRAGQRLTAKATSARKIVSVFAFNTP